MGLSQLGASKVSGASRRQKPHGTLKLSVNLEVIPAFCQKNVTGNKKRDCLNFHIGDLSGRKRMM
jgi:hypothetical protein